MSALRKLNIRKFNINLPKLFEARISRAAIAEALFLSFNFFASRVLIMNAASPFAIAYLSAFLGMDISYEAVVQAMYLGDLGRQTVIKGEHAYSILRQARKITICGDEYEQYRAQHIKRDSLARSALKQVRDIPGIMVDEIIRNGGIRK